MRTCKKKKTERGREGGRKERRKGGKGKEAGGGMARQGKKGKKMKHDLSRGRDSTRNVHVVMAE